MTDREIPLIQKLQRYAAIRNCTVSERWACAVDAGAAPYYVQYPLPSGGRGGRDAQTLRAALAIIVNANRAVQDAKLATLGEEYQDVRGR